MGKVKLKSDKAAEKHFIPAVLGAEIQDILMNYADKYKYDTSILITEERGDKNNNTLELIMTRFVMDWKERKWVKEKKQEHEKFHPRKAIKEDFHDFYWNLQVCGVSIMNGLRYRDFQTTYNEAVYWEKTE